MSPSSKQAAQAVPKRAPCPHCGAPGEVYSEQPFYLAVQCLAKSCRRCWYACAKCGHLTLEELTPPQVCPECGADRRPIPKIEPSTFRGIVLPNVFGMGLQAEIDRAAREHAPREADHAA